MTLRLEMLQVARLAPKLLGDAADNVAAFLRSQFNPDGGFKDRAGGTDLYYTVFGIEGLFSLRADLPLAQLRGYLTKLGAGESLDFVHVACLARCWAMFGGVGPAPAIGEKILASLEHCRSKDGLYAATAGQSIGTIYHTFLAFGAYQDLGSSIPEPQEVLDAIQSLRAADGGYANQSDLPVGLTPPTAAAVTLLRQMHQPVDPTVGDWLLARCGPEGGFRATPDAPIPDLLSTATALHALVGMKADIEPIRERCLDFLDTLWHSDGAFLGSWEDESLDVEYTYYGLLALGHLSV